MTDKQKKNETKVKRSKEAALTAAQETAHKESQENKEFLGSLLGGVGLSSLGGYTAYYAISIDVAARSFNDNKLSLPIFGECQMMKLLVYSTTYFLPFLILVTIILYASYQRYVKDQGDGEFFLPSSLGLQKTPPAFRNKVAIFLTIVGLVIPVLVYADLSFQLQKYCRIVPSRVLSTKISKNITDSDSLTGAELLLYPLKRPGTQPDRQYYWINHYKTESNTADGVGGPGLVKVEAFPLQPLLIALFSMSFIVFMARILWRAFLPHFWMRRKE